MPLMAGIENTAWLIMDSTESKNGSPSPIGNPFTLHSTIPPILSFERGIALEAPFQYPFHRLLL